MRAIEAGHGPVEIAIARIPRGWRRTQRFAPRVRSLVCKTIPEPLRDLRFQRMVDRISRVSINAGAVELRIEVEEVFREAAIADEAAAFPRDVRALFQKIRKTEHVAVRYERPCAGVFAQRG